jgi:hypothetical protein
MDMKGIQMSIIALVVTLRFPGPINGQRRLKLPLIDRRGLRQEFSGELSFASLFPRNSCLVARGP